MSYHYHILITDFIHSCFFDLMNDMPCTIDYRPDISREEVLDIIGRYDVLLVNSRIPADQSILERATNLKVVGRIGSGMEVIDTDFAAQRHIACINAPEGNKDAVAEHALGMLLCLFHRIHLANTEVKSGLWLREKNRGSELGGKTIGIIGYGHNGSAFAEKLKGMNVSILAYDKYKKNFSSEYVKEATLDEIFSCADIVSLHIPLTQETDKMFNKQFIMRFAKPFFLINIARGKIVNTTDLIEALQSGKILGACLDVLENENLDTLTEIQKHQYDQLRQMDQVILTPHIAGWTHESKQKIARALAAKLHMLL